MSKQKQPDLIRVYGVGRYEDSYITFGADPEILNNDYDEFVKFVKGCEVAVRKDDRYTHYVGKIRSSGFDHCAVLGHVTSENDKVELEMHHGPVLNLFDYCAIVLRALLKRGDCYPLTTFDVADRVLTEHEKDHICVVMLTKTAHKAAHKNLFIDMAACVGHVEKFVEKYADGMDEEHWESIERYIKEYNRHADKGTMDQGVFDTFDKLASFHRE